MLADDATVNLARFMSDIHLLWFGFTEVNSKITVEKITQ